MDSTTNYQIFYSHAMNIFIIIFEITSKRFEIVIRYSQSCYNLIKLIVAY